jgi:hypothetical protein
MNDFYRSLNRALVRDNWLVDDRCNRIGSPFEWVDGENMGDSYTKQMGPYDVLQAVAMYYEEYPTLDSVKTDDHDMVWQDIANVLRSLVDRVASYPGVIEKYTHNINLTALTRVQDYCFIRKHALDMPSAPQHLDIGPGLGSHAIYSLRQLNSHYTGLEATSFFYGVQRQVFRFLSSDQIKYFDPIIAESLEVNKNEIIDALRNNDKYRIKHLPSWFAESLEDETKDLVTATFVLNEVTPAGISWLLTHATRALKVGGIMHIRDSYKNKPNRHALKYDDVLLEMGFELIHHEEVENRVDMYGIPRIYRKTKHAPTTFEEFFNRYFGRNAVTIHGGDLMQNLTE